MQGGGRAFSMCNGDYWERATCYNCGVEARVPDGLCKEVTEGKWQCPCDAYFTALAHGFVKRAIKGNSTCKLYCQACIRTPAVVQELGIDENYDVQEVMLINNASAKIKDKLCSGCLAYCAGYRNDCIRDLAPLKHVLAAIKDGVHAHEVLVAQAQRATRDAVWGAQPQLYPVDPDAEAAGQVPFLRPGAPPAGYLGCLQPQRNLVAEQGLQAWVGQPAHHDMATPDDEDAEADGHDLHPDYYRLVKHLKNKGVIGDSYDTELSGSQDLPAAADRGAGSARQSDAQNSSGAQSWTELQPRASADAA